MFVNNFKYLQRVANCGEANILLSSRPVELRICTMTTRSQAHAENVARAKAMDDKLAIFGSRHSPAIGVSKTVEVRRNMLDVGASTVAAPVRCAKADRAALHPRLKSVEGRLSHNAARLLDHVVRMDEQFGGSRLIDVVVQQIASAFDLPEKEAEEARTELEQLGLISWFDNFSGDRGFRPTV
ncbi:hypothetical protein [Sinorhizobium prairiense]|uniref:hypothetical protein n=1 Tax=unclassified Sinorhizobium TaxID=2613772 RepID=UPI0023D7E8F4|nr:MULTISPECIES: hypothetical protein [unclassified Sinorhizobium]WEJ09296.1 hypothetical protein N0Q90_14395 [Sinorhizobium sp. M103]WEJ16161.1 hypothetical protein N0Q91_05920 [Sinorhizobium sp. K101]WEJ36261.1 hypothetical protein N0R80_14370 [Sinorhizobium sp. C101]